MKREDIKVGALIEFDKGELDTSTQFGYAFSLINMPVPAVGLVYKIAEPYVRGIRVGDAAWLMVENKKTWISLDALATIGKLVTA